MTSIDFNRRHNKIHIVVAYIFDNIFWLFVWSVLLFLLFFRENAVECCGSIYFWEDYLVFIIPIWIWLFTLRQYRYNDFVDYVRVFPKENVVEIGRSGIVRKPPVKIQLDDVDVCFVRNETSIGIPYAYSLRIFKKGDYVDATFSKYPPMVCVQNSLGWSKKQLRAIHSCVNAVDAQ